MVRSSARIALSGAVHDGGQRQHDPEAIGVAVDLLLQVEALPEADLLDREIAFCERQLLRQRHPLASSEAQAGAQEIAEELAHTTRRLRIRPHQRVDRVEAIEEEVGIE